MEDTLISFETAKLAKEKELPILIRFGFITKFYHPLTKTLLSYGRTGRVDRNILCYAPTQSLLQKWLREVHNIIATSDPIIGFDKCEYSWNIYTFKNIWHLRKFTSSTYNTYEEALEMGLFEALKLI